MMSADPRLVGLIGAARRILVFTGAGISTGSGIPDYRGPDGLWKTRQPVFYQDFLSSHDARVEYWDQKVTGWPLMRDSRPNPTHRAIARLEEAGKVVLVATQNIDGLHVRAGTSEERIVELHGTVRKVECVDCHTMSEPEAHLEAFSQTRQPPTCVACGGFLKSATISFGQNLRPQDLDRAFAAAEHTDLVIALGSTLSVQPAASIPLMAVQRGVPYAIINRGATEHDDIVGVTLRLEGDVSEILPPAVAEVVGSC
jgi:NAD-dependent deacetylase